jgi:WD40 repeat protein
MDRLPAQRYQTAAELAADLQRFLAGEPIQARRVGAWRRAVLWARRRPAAAALLLVSGLAALALVGVGVALFYSASLEEKNVRLQEAFDEADQLRQAEAEQRRQAELNQYLHHIARAQAELGHGNLSQARRLLDDCHSDQRSWEWQYLDRLCHGELLTLRGSFVQADKVTFCLMFTPDGTRLAWIGQTGVQVWDASTGDALPTFKGLAGSFKAAVLNPNGSRVATVDAAGTTVKVWDVTTGREERSFPGLLGAIENGALSPDGTRLVSISPERTLMVWDTTTGKRLYTTLERHPDPFYSAVFSPDGTRLASASHGTVKVWDATTGKELRLDLKAPKGYATKVVFSPDGTRLAAGGFREVKVWDATTGQEVSVFRGLRDVYPLAFSPDGRWLAASGGERIVTVWDVTTGQEVRSFRGHSWNVGGLAFSPDGSRLASGDLQGTVKVWDVTSDQESLTLQDSTDWITCVALNREGTLLASSSHDSKTVKVWDTTTGQLQFTLTGHGERVWSVAFSPDGKTLASASEDRKVRLWDVSTRQVRLTFTGHTGSVSCVTFSPDGRWVASATGMGPLAQIDQPGEVKIWDPRNGEVIQTPHGHTRGISTVVFSPDGTRLASADNGGTVRVWNTTTREEVFSLQASAFSAVVHGVAFSPDGSRIATGNWDTTGKIWDARTGAELHTLRGPNEVVNAVAFSRDGKRLAAAIGSTTLQVWDVDSEQEVLTLRGFTSYVWTLAFSADRTRLAAGGGDGMLKIWDTRPWTAEVVAEREAVGLLNCLFAKPLCQADVLDYVQNARTISPRARQTAKALVGRYREEADPERYYQASRAIVRQPHLNRVQYDFALRQARTACRLAPDKVQYQITVGEAEARLRGAAPAPKP